MNKIELKVNHLIKTSHTSLWKGKDISYIEQYLKSLGIKMGDIPSFIDRPRETDEDNPRTLLNINKAVEAAHTKLSGGAKAFVVVDSDTDGYTSASILINYLKRRFPNIDIQWALHPGKEHGIVLKDIPEDREIIFVPDAGSNNIEEQKALVDQGKTVIILDHHDVEVEGDSGAIIVNNQFSPAFENKFMSGAGVVYMFITLMDDLYYPGQPIARDYLDLTAIGIIADAMNMTSLGNNYIAFHGLRNIRNPFIQAIIKRLHDPENPGMSRIKNPKVLTKIDVAFYIAPIINGVIRNGDPEDKEVVFRAMSEENNTEDFVSVWRGVTRHETLYDNAARLAANAKARQDSAKKKSFEWLCGKIREEGHDKDNIIVVALDDKDAKKINPNLTGLIAMELVKEFNRPSLVLRHTFYEGKEVYGGSGRNGNFYGITNLKEFCQSVPVYYAEGHGNAFGAFLLEDEIEKLRNKANIELNPSSFDSVYEVDYMFKDNSDIDEEMLFQMASYDELWGNSIPQPRFSFKIRYTKTDTFIMGKDRSSIKIRCGNVDFVAFKDAALAEKLINTPYGVATIVGRPQINEFNGHINIQIMIDDIDIEASDEIVSKPKTLFDLI